MADRIVVLEAAEYRQAQEALAADPIMQNMAGGLAGVAREELCHEDGGPRFEFMMAARDQYEKRGGKVASYGMGDYAKALLMLLDEKASAAAAGAAADAKIAEFKARKAGA